MSARLTFSSGTSVSVVAELHSKFNHHPYTNCDQTSASNLSHDLLQVGHIVGGTNQSSSATKEGVGTSCIYNGVLLSLLDGRARETDIVGVLLDWQ